jgi:hypothetical protein
VAERIQRQRDVPRGTLAADPLVRALVACLREVAERRAAEDAERRRTMTVVGSDRQGRHAA